MIFLLLKLPICLYFYLRATELIAYKMRVKIPLNFRDRLKLSGKNVELCHPRQTEKPFQRGKKLEENNRKVEIPLREEGLGG